MRPNKSNNRPTVTIFYDSFCPVCSKSMRVLRKLDTRLKFRYESIRDNSILEMYHINKEAAEKRMHTLRIKDQKIETGIFSIQRILKQLPLLWVFVPFVQLSIWAGAGSKLYDWLAERRTILPVGGCDGDSCPIPKQKSR
ncbi:thiol-disulfide oxidoreductase DCC family protein [Halobacillus sp. H74]|uniref:thiol-disulfide oxidoreductase DCC family protein n=1 Tax=Halobacillus sp. H74 TaxID=3457436 RepID=UPI003FCDF499